MRAHAEAWARRRHDGRPPLPADEVAWRLVRAALGEARTCAYLHQQACAYSSSVERLRAAGVRLAEEVALYGRTLEQVRPTGDQAKGGGGGGGGGAPLRYSCSGEKVQRKGLLAGGAWPAVSQSVQEGGAEPSRAASRGVWSRATFSFELRAHGDLSVRAEAKGRPLWEGSVRLDDCLRRRAEGALTVEVNEVEMAIGPLLDLLDAKLFRASTSTGSAKS